MTSSSSLKNGQPVAGGVTVNPVAVITNDYNDHRDLQSREEWTSVNSRKIQQLSEKVGVFIYFRTFLSSSFFFLFSFLRILLFNA